MVKPFPADDYEVFIYSILQIGPFIFIAALFAIYYAADISKPGAVFGKYAFAVSVVFLIMALVLDVILMPKVRFR